MPECELGGVLDTILKCILGVRAKFGVGARILVQKMEVYYDEGDKMSAVY